MQLWGDHLITVGLFSGSHLVLKSIRAMAEEDADEVLNMENASSVTIS